VPEDSSMTISMALKDKEGVGELVLRRLSAAGLVTVDQLLLASPDEIAALAGIHVDIVHTILGHLSQDALLGSGDRTFRGHERDGEACPPDLELLHEQILEELRSEAEMESAREELKEEIRGLRSRIIAGRAELQSIDVRRDDGAGGPSSELIDEHRARYVVLERRYAASEATIRQMEARLRALRIERRSVEEDVVGLCREVAWLVGRIDGVRRMVATRRMEQ